MGRPREHGNDTAQALLRAAEKRLQHGGLDGVSLRAIADDAGVSVRAVYSLFGDKNGLIDALVGEAFERLAIRVEKLPATSDPVTDLVNAGVNGFRRFALDQPEMYRLTFERGRVVPSGAPPWAASGQRAQQALQRWVQRALADHPSRIAKIREVVAQFHAICQGLASCEINGVLLGMGARQPKRLWREALTSYLAGLGIADPMVA